MSNDNIAVGQAALKTVSGSQNIALGASAGASLTAASNGVFIGYQAGSNALQKVDAANSIAIGAAAYTTKNNQAVIGTGDTVETVLFGDLRGGRAGGTRVFDDYGDNNIFIGCAGVADTTTFTGSGALGIGPGALANSTSGQNAIAIGIDALRNNAGNDHTAVGNEALKALNGSATVGNTAVGRRSFGLCTTGSPNTGVGDTAGYETTTGMGVNAFGYGAAWKNTVGNYIVAAGAYAGAGHGKSSRWVAIGENAMSLGTVLPDGPWDTAADTVSDNVAVGFYALFVTAGPTSVAVGAEAHRNYEGTTGRLDGVGFRAGQRLTGGGTCTFVGYQTGENENQKVDAVNSTALGANAYTTKNNQVSLGGDAVTETVLHGIVLSTVYTVGTLPAAAAGLTGARAFVSDATATVFNDVVAGGGANKVPVFCDGASWRIG